MNKKEIIVVTVELTNGGAERVLTELINSWIKFGHKVSVIQTRPNLFGNSYGLDSKVEIINLNICAKNKIFRYVKTFFKLINILNKHKNATVISFVNPTTILLALSSFFIKNKMVFSERCDPLRTPSNKIKRLIRNLAFCFADVCVFQTNDALKSFPSLVKSHSIIIPNPIKDNLPDRFVGIRKKIIVTACRIEPQKNLELLISAFSEFHKKHSDYILKIYGLCKNIDYMNHLLQIIRRKKLDNNVFFPGFVSNIHDKMKDCRMFVLSSDYEGISNSLLEAMGIGMPVISTDCPVGGSRFLIENYVNGILIPVGDSKSLYKAMVKLAEENDFLNNISANAVKVKDRFEKDTIANTWLGII